MITKIKKNLPLEINIGFICSAYSSRLSTNHTLRLKNLNKNNLIRCVRRNLEDLIKLLNLSQELGCKIFRLGSQFIPFASHSSFNKSWLKEIKNLIKDYTPEIKKFNIRITMHPGQYVVLSTDDKRILKRSLAELTYHFWALEKLEIDKNGIVVIHGGGHYGDKFRAIKNLTKNINKNKWLKERLALENDEKIYNAEDISKICQELSIPFVFDYFHHNIYSSSININEVLKTWGRRVPEFHISSQGFSKFKHGDYVRKNDFLDFMNLIKGSTVSIRRIDILLEAKRKELAIKKLLKEIDNLEI